MNAKKTPPPTGLAPALGSEARHQALLKAAQITQSGYGGVLGNGQIVDRREHPDAVAMQENSMMEIPAPRRVELRDCPNCYGGHQRPCQWCGDTGKVVWVEDNGGCPEDCGHSPSEHQAFDRGVIDGRALGIEAPNPYDADQSPQEWDAWETGKSVGAQEHRDDPLNSD
jgi:hypothetical protein